MLRRTRRVVITGLGVVAPNGIGKEAFWSSLLAGKSGIDYVNGFDVSRHPCKVAGEIRDFDALDFMNARTAKRLSRCSQLGVAAARLATEDAGLDANMATFGAKAGVYFGTSTAGSGDVGEINHARFLADRTSALNPLAMLEFSAHATTSHVVEALAIGGPSTTVSSGCASGLDALRWATSQIQLGQLGIAVVGAVDAPVTEFIFSLFCAGPFLTKWTGEPSKASRPYDLLRSGLVLSEASAAMILEDYDSASARNARIYGEILGTGSCAEGAFPGKPEELYRRGLEQAFLSSFGDAGISPRTLDYINAHGNSTQSDDAAETAVYKKLLGERVYSVPITSIKGAVGQPLAAGGLLQAVSVALTFEREEIPPTINYETQDPLCDLDYVPNVPRIARIRTAFVHSHSLGGPIPGSHAAAVLGAL
jgi:3-oxoacyl-[acyl-carrier-protein] synthase II